jgi:hypothetical protein
MPLPPKTLWRLALVLAFVCGAAWRLASDQGPLP